MSFVMWKSDTMGFDAPKTWAKKEENYITLIWGHVFTLEFLRPTLDFSVKLQTNGVFLLVCWIGSHNSLTFDECQSQREPLEIFSLLQRTISIELTYCNSAPSNLVKFQKYKGE